MLSTDKQKNQRYQKHNLLCQGGNYQFFSWRSNTQTHTLHKQIDQHTVNIDGNIIACITWIRKPTRRNSVQGVFHGSRKPRHSMLLIVFDCVAKKKKKKEKKKCHVAKVGNLIIPLCVSGHFAVTFSTPMGIVLYKHDFSALWKYKPMHKWTYIWIHYACCLTNLRNTLEHIYISVCRLAIDVDYSMDGVCSCFVRYMKQNRYITCWQGC